MAMTAEDNEERGSLLLTDEMATKEDVKDMGNQDKTIDEALLITGGFGRFQWLLLLMMAYCMMTLGLQGLTMTFIANEPGWKCTHNISKCANVTGYQRVGMKGYDIRCRLKRSEWEYEKSFTSIVTKYDLYCDRSILKNIATSMVYLGWFIGSILFGAISDKYGRKNTLLISTVLMGVAGVISSFAPFYWLFTVLKTIVGIGIGGSMISIFILNTEFSGPKKRCFAGIFVWNFWVIGLCLVTLFAYLIKDWRYLNLTTSIPGVLVICLVKNLPESVRWLQVHGKTKEVEIILRKIAKTNNTTYPEDLTLKVMQHQTSGSMIEIITHRKLFIYTLLSMFVWLTCSMIYYGISLSVGHLGGSIYLTFFLTTIITIPANFTATFLIDRYGRKKILLITLAFAAVAMIGAVLFPSKTNDKGLVIGRVIMAMLAKFNIVISFDAAYLITYEIYPTTLRNLGMGMSSAAARVGSFSASYIIYLVEIKRILPYMVFAAIAVLCTFLSCILPETNNTATKETLDSSDEKNDELVMSVK